MLRSFILMGFVSLALLAFAVVSDAEACCGPNSSPEFFRHQHHAFKPGHVPGYLNKHRHRRPMFGGTR